MRKQRDNRGGYRSGAGRKGEWKSGKTKAVKLPEKIVLQVMTLARAIDEGHEVRIIKTGSVTESKEDNFESVTQSNTAHNESVTESKTVQEAVTILTEALALKPNAGGAIKGEIRKALKVLEGEE